VSHATNGVEQYVRLSEIEELRVALEPTRSGYLVVRVGLRVRRFDGTDALTPVFSLEPKDVRTVSRAFAALADALDHAGPVARGGY